MNGILRVIAISFLCGAANYAGQAAAAKLHSRSKR